MARKYQKNDIRLDIYICTLCEKMSESVSPNKIPLITIIKLVSESDPSSKKNSAQL